MFFPKQPSWKNGKHKKLTLPEPPPDLEPFLFYKKNGFVSKFCLRSKSAFVVVVVVVVGSKKQWDDVKTHPAHLPAWNRLPDIVSALRAARHLVPATAPN